MAFFRFSSNNTIHESIDVAGFLRRVRLYSTNLGRKVRSGWDFRKIFIFMVFRNWRRKQFYLKTCIRIHYLWIIRIWSWTLKERSAPKTGSQTDDSYSRVNFDPTKQSVSIWEPILSGIGCHGGVIYHPCTNL